MSHRKSAHEHSAPVSLDDLIQQSDMPPPGPEYFEARRALWLTPRPSVRKTKPSPELLRSRQKLEELLNAPDAVHSDRIWKLGVHKVWSSLAAGGRLKQRLPLKVLMKIVLAAWIRDQTWPAGAIVPESEDEALPYEPPSPPPLLPRPSIDSTDISHLRQR